MSLGVQQRDTIGETVEGEIPVSRISEFSDDPLSKILDWRYAYVEAIRCVFGTVVAPSSSVISTSSKRRSRVLDLDINFSAAAGCGRGAFSLLLASQPFVSECVGVDPRESYVAYATERARQTRCTNARFVRIGSDGNLPFASGSFDVVFSMAVVNGLSRSRALNLFKDACRVLRPGGVLCIMTNDQAQAKLRVDKASSSSLWPMKVYQQPGTSWLTVEFSRLNLDKNSRDLAESKPYFVAREIKRPLPTQGFLRELLTTAGYQGIVSHNVFENEDSANRHKGDEIVIATLSPQIQDIVRLRLRQVHSYIARQNIDPPFVLITAHARS